ncbi:hypothetical protein I545_6802 [Mycobacterium kansasii 662]|uniref:Uncharacterized protein n=1 Tax=Mycobacterium kansasii 662 TaxID=1299326 RepID=X7XRW5_MYCKA|nr:hypothetical protein I545_6802 [Mycobacterium kansasii 662]
MRWPPKTRSPLDKHLTSSAVSVPGVLLTQIAAIRALARQGMDLVATPPVALAGHSQGGAGGRGAQGRWRSRRGAAGVGPADRAAGTLVARAGAGSRCSAIVHRWCRSPTADPERIQRLLEDFAQDVRTVPAAGAVHPQRPALGRHHRYPRAALALRTVLPSDLGEGGSRPQKQGPWRRRLCAGIRAGTGGGGPFHTPRLGDGIDIVGSWAEKVGLDIALARELAESILGPQGRLGRRDHPRPRGRCARWILDLGPGDILTRLTAPVIRGLGIGNRARLRPAAVSATSSP